LEVKQKLCDLLPAAGDQAGAVLAGDQAAALEQLGAAAPIAGDQAGVPSAISCFDIGPRLVRGSGRARPRQARGRGPRDD